jgi:hypothetical protein
MSAITQAERQKYAEIFQARGQVNGYMSGKICSNYRDEKLKLNCFLLLTGAAARDVLLNSNLPPNRLERIW